MSAHGSLFPYLVALGGLALAFGIALAVTVVVMRVTDAYRFNRWMARKGNL